MTKSNKKVKTEQYNFDEFEQQINLDNIIADKRTISLLRIIVNRIQSGFFKRPPSLIISGKDGGRTLAISVANSLKSKDIKIIEGRYLLPWQRIVQFFSGTNNSVYIILNPERISISDSIVWELIKNRKFKLTNFDGTRFANIKIKGNGIIILVTDDIKLVQEELLSIVDFKIQAKKLTKKQLKKIISQRLEFSKVKFNNNIIDEIIKLSKIRLDRVINVLKICILLVQDEKRNQLTMKIVKKAASFLPDNRKSNVK